MIKQKNIEKMDNSESKQLMLILAKKGQPYVKKHDGYAVKVEEDEQITWTDYENRECTMSIPAGSYIMVGEDSSCPHIVTKKEFDDSNSLLEGKALEEEEEKEESEEEEKEEKEEKPKEKVSKAKIKIGLSTMED